MDRRTTLKTIGASVLAGATVTGAAAADDSAEERGPRVVNIDSETSTRNVDRSTDTEYTVDYRDNGTVQITGSIPVPNPCHEATVVGIESTEFGDVVQVGSESDAGICIQVIARLDFEITVQYPDEADDVFVQFPQ